MNQRTRAAAAAVGVGVIFLAIQLAALALVDPFKGAGYQTVENPGDPTNSVVYIVAVLVATGLMLAAFKFDVEWAIRAMIVLSGGYISMIVLDTIAPAAIPSVAGLSTLALVGAAGIVIGLLVYPEWWVIDTAGVFMGAGAAGLFGITFGVLPALVLLTVLAVYDAISVYGTEHMLTLASGVMDLKIPVVLVVPLSLSYTFLDDEQPASVGGEDDAATPTADGGDESVDGDGTDEGDEHADEAGDPLDRDALFIGLGDAVIPAVLVASAAFFTPGSVPTFDLPLIALTLPAATAMVGTFVGLAVLLSMVLKGRAHAGLPLLNGGAIGGYLVGSLVAGVPVLTALGL
ncbi:hypothetical protein GJ629_08690 [Halapricum sp. CBA1109]|uniref:presenilin family intramembrane aspartyl protease PSH n=1 Tax=Halapricum sp. CBA1109 TaxID=2668068 RepID=UPI0012F8A4D6|nr:presenilin family intramembrane aspartyl protease PSH [Halapricum sp. CBA1109]MUV89959.1 hypothetical protein [Halapricum sp. CBA1109]